MKRILKMSSCLFVDLDTGYCSCSETVIADKNKDRLSEAPLRVLNYLVHHRDIVCKTSDLEELFSGMVSEDKSPRIRGYINRIKTVFGRIDPYFNSDEGKAFIKSIYQKGYVFTLPKEGELIYITSPLQTLQLMDPIYIGEQKKSALKKMDDVRSRFHQMVEDWDNTFRAVLLDIDEQGTERWKLLNDLEKYVLEADCCEGVTAITSRGADGKTVLLAQFAKRCSENHPNWNIYYLNTAQNELTFDAIEAMIDYFRQNGIGKIRKNILLIDAPDLMSSSFRKLLKKLQEEKIEWLYVLFTCRLSELVMALQNDLVSEKYPPVRAFLISSEGKEDSKSISGTDISLLNDMAKQVSGFYVSEKLRKAVLKKIAVSEFQKAAGWTDEKLNSLLNELEYSKKNFVNLYLELFCQAADTSECAEENLIAKHSCKGSLPWEDWEKMFRNADQLCQKQKLSGVFPYVMAFLKQGLSVTTVFLYSMTGYTSVSALRELLAGCDNEWFYFADDKIKVRHKSVLDAYFLLHPVNSAQKSFETLLQETWMDTDTLMHFVTHILGRKMYSDSANSPTLLNMYSLVMKLFGNQKYMKILADNSMMHIPEIAYLWLEYGPEFYESDLSGMKRAFEASFDRLLASTDHELTQFMYWKEMLILATYYFDKPPKWLTEYYDSQSDENKSGLMNVLEEEYTSGEKYRGNQWHERMRRYITHLMGRENDQQDEQTDEQLFTDDVFSRHPELYAIQMLEDQLFQMMSEQKDPEKMAQLTEIIFTQYENTYKIASAKNDKELLMCVLIKWAYMNYRILNYQECFRLIKMAQEKIPDTQEGAYWIYYMEGIMREGPGFPEFGLKNPFYNIQKAEEAYLKAYRIYMKYGDKNQAEPYIVILKSLAELYYTQGDKQKEMDVYRLIEQRVPASIIRDEIHAEADNKVRSGLDEDIVIRFGFDNENS